MTEATTGIRTAEPDDGAEITRLCIEFGYPATRQDIDARLAVLLGGEQYLVAVADGPGGTLLGWLEVEHRILLESGDTAEIVGLVVDGRERRRGVGRAFVAVAERWATGRGLTQMTVRSNVARKEAHVFYQGLGFTRAKTQNFYVKRLFPGTRSVAESGHAPGSAR